MKILVTGGLGFIGSHTVVELQNEGFEVVIIEIFQFYRGCLKSIIAITGKMPVFEKLDLREKTAVQGFKRHVDVVGVIHFAASKAVREKVLKSHCVL
jgi:UDP-glucose 4-epimerase